MKPETAKWQIIRGGPPSIRLLTIQGWTAAVIIRREADIWEWIAGSSAGYRTSLSQARAAVLRVLEAKT